MRRKSNAVISATGQAHLGKQSHAAPTVSSALTRARAEPMLGSAQGSGVITNLIALGKVSALGPRVVGPNLTISHSHWLCNLDIIQPPRAPCPPDQIIKAVAYILWERSVWSYPAGNLQILLLLLYCWLWLKQELTLFSQCSLPSTPSNISVVSSSPTAYNESDIQSTLHKYNRMNGHLC